jgi:hypothetical protein
MKIWFPAAAASLLIACTIACNDAPVAKAPEKPLELVTGRQAFYQTYPQARTWAIDAQPLRVRSVELTERKSDGAKAAAWEVTYVSAAKGRSRIYMWSSIEAQGNVHKGVFASQEESWRAGGADHAFVIQAFKIDTPEALETAIAHSDVYFKNPASKPPPRFVLEATSRFPDPVWRVYWGESVSTAEWSVFVDATTGAYQGR